MTELIFNDDVKEDFDNTENAINFYEKKYSISGTRVLIQGKEIEVSGECVYNFGTRYEKLKAIIAKEQNIEKRKTLNNNLEVCRKLHHSLPNIMVLPKCGGLNTLKGEIYYSTNHKEWRVKKGQFRASEWFDRPDLLVCYINEYYTQKPNLNKMSFRGTGEYLSNGVFTSSIMHGETFSVLLDTLDSFTRIEDFCSMFYQIDDKLMISDWLNGKNFFVKDNIAKYLNQAFAFWSLQMKNIFEMLINNKDICIVVKGDDVKNYVQEQLSEYPDNNQLIFESGKGCYRLRKKEQ